MNVAWPATDKVCFCNYSPMKGESQDFHRYFHKNIISKLVKTLEDEAVHSMMQGMKPQKAIQEAGLCYVTGKSKYRALCRRFYRRRDSRTKKRKEERKKKEVIQINAERAKECRQLKVQLARHRRKGEQVCELKRIVNEAVEKERVAEKSKINLEQEDQRWRTR